jgi:hypothetical protein
MFKMLGKEHEGDLEREAAKRRRAAEIGARQGDEPEATLADSKANHVPPLLSRVAALWRSARAES